MRRKLAQILETSSVRPKVVAETPNSSTVCALAMEGLGVGLVNPYASDGYAARGVVFRPFSAAVHRTDTWRYCWRMFEFQSAISCWERGEALRSHRAVSDRVASTIACDPSVQQSARWR